MIKTNVNVGDTFHATSSGLSIPAEADPNRPIGDPGRVLLQGEEFTVTEAFLAATLDRAGRTWLSLTEEEQEARWGRVRFRRGPAPEDVTLGGDDDAFRVREFTRRSQGITDPSELRELRNEYSDVASLISEY